MMKDDLLPIYKKVCKLLGLDQKRKGRRRPRPTRKDVERDTNVLRRERKRTLVIFNPDEQS